MYYTAIGEGSPLILLHGFLENASMWDPFVHKLSETKKVITIDLLGHGRTACIGYCHSMEMMAEAIFAVLKHEKVKSFSVVGHSMGGYVALALAKQYPEMIDTLCLLNSTPMADSKEKKEIRSRGIEAAKKNYEQVVRLSVRNLFAETSREKFLKEIALVTNEALKTPLQGYIAAQEGMRSRLDLLHFFRNSTFNKKMILGKHDIVLDWRPLKKSLQDSDVELVIFSGGHMSHIEQFFGVLNRLSKI